MGFIRVIHQKYYDPDSESFASLAFKPSSDGSGISVIDEDCLHATSPSCCSHINKYCRDVAGSPPIFWVIRSQDLPAECECVHSRSASEDECHCNIQGLTKHQARRIFKSISLSDMRICIDGETDRALSAADLQ
jgi:hypothetical protein